MRPKMGRDPDAVNKYNHRSNHISLASDNPSAVEPYRVRYDDNFEYNSDEPLQEHISSKRRQVSNSHDNSTINDQEGSFDYLRSHEINIPQKVSRAERLRLKHMFKLQLERVQALLRYLSEIETVETQATSVDSSDKFVGKRVRSNDHGNPKMPSKARRGPDGKFASNKPRVKRKAVDCKAGLMDRCKELLQTLMNQNCSWIFNEPVDPVRWECYDYFNVITSPMDLGTIKNRLEGNRYSNPMEFASDVRLTFANAKKYNPPKHFVYGHANTLSKMFEHQWKAIEAEYRKFPGGNSRDPIITSNKSKQTVRQEIDPVESNARVCRLTFKDKPNSQPASVSRSLNAYDTNPKNPPNIATQQHQPPATCKKNCENKKAISVCRAPIEDDRPALPNPSKCTGISSENQNPQPAPSVTSRTSAECGSPPHNGGKRMMTDKEMNILAGDFGELPEIYQQRIFIFLENHASDALTFLNDEEREVDFAKLGHGTLWKLQEIVSNFQSQAKADQKNNGERKTETWRHDEAQCADHSKESREPGSDSYPNIRKEGDDESGYEEVDIVGGDTTDPPLCRISIDPSSPSRTTSGTNSSSSDSDSDSDSVSDSSSSSGSE